MATEDAEIIEPPDTLETEPIAQDAEITPPAEDAANVPQVISSGARFVRR